VTVPSRLKPKTFPENKLIEVNDDAISFVFYLWRVNDGRKLVDAKHAQVGDGKGASLELV
jgi:hypothetical protein